MKFTLDLNENIIIRYAESLGYENPDPQKLKEEKYFTNTIIEILEQSLLDEVQYK